MKFPKNIVLSLTAVGLFFSSALAAGDPGKGKVLFTDPKLGGGTAGFSCDFCHPNGKGLEKATDRKGLTKVINSCIKDALKGKGLEPNSSEMADLISYIRSLKKKGAERGISQKKMER
jgi:hypothetical protein